MCENNACEANLYEDASPYPKIQVISPNEYYANLLFEDYSGQTSEMTAFLQYEYHYTYNCRYEERIVRHLRRIASVERKHMEILARLITMLGEYPVYRRGFQYDKSCWSGNQVTYGRLLDEQLHMDLEQEYKTISNYNTHIKLINDPGIKEVLKRIIKDEYAHTYVLQSLLRGDC